MALPTTKSMTIDEFETFIALPENHDRRLELINGEIVEKNMPTDLHSITTNMFLYYFTQYALEHGKRMPGPERSFRIPGDTKNWRVPDASWIIERGLPVTDEGAVARMPDIIVEVKSPRDSYEDQRSRARFYIENGAKLAILAFPRDKTLEVYRPGVPTETLTVEDTLFDEDVLPGFVLPVAKIFEEGQ